MASINLQIKNIVENSPWRRLFYIANFPLFFFKNKRQKIWKNQFNYKSGEFQDFIFSSRVINIGMMITNIKIDFQVFNDNSYQHCGSLTWRETV